MGKFVVRHSGHSTCLRSTLAVTAQRRFDFDFDFLHANREETVRKKGKAGGSVGRKECDSFAVVLQ